MKWMFCLALFWSFPSMAKPATQKGLVSGALILAEVTQTRPRPRPTSAPSSSSTTLPNCVNDPQEINRIKEVISANKQTRHKYDGYRQALQSDSAAQLFARLAYAETVAANCPDSQTQVSQAIVSVIGNRVRKRNGDVASVVFQRDQFASSLNIYGRSRYLDFLCPQNQQLWDQIMGEVQEVLASNRTRLNSQTYHYFLYQHDPRWTKEPWEFREDRTPQFESSRSCLRSFENPSWR